MKLRRNQHSHGFGKADPFGLLVVAVLLAVSLTIAVQAQVSRGQDQGLFEHTVAPWLPWIDPQRLSAESGRPNRIGPG